MKRFGSIVLAFVLAVSFMPVFGQFAFASDKDAAQVDATEVHVNSDIFSDVNELDGVQTQKGPLGLFKSEADTDYEVGKVQVESAEDTQNLPIQASGTIEYPQSQMYTKESPYATLDVQLNELDGTARITGEIKAGVNASFGDLYIDGYSVGEGVYGETKIQQTVDMKEFEVGYHDVWADFAEIDGVDDVSDEWVAYPLAIPTLVYEKPANGKTYYYVENKSFVYYASDVGSYYYDSDCDICLQYKKGKANWGKTYFVSPYSNMQMTKCKPSAKYKIRTYYGKVVYYNGEEYFLSGMDSGYVSKIVTIKMGTKKKPPVRSVKAVKVKRKKLPYTIIYNGYVFNYLTTYKIKVKMKKKPKAKGVIICQGSYSNMDRRKGNKKSYTTKKKFGVYSSKKHFKFKTTVIVYSYQDNKYGGFSPDYKKTLKVKK